MLLDRHRFARLLELAEKERRVTGPERLLLEEDVALLIKAAYDDAGDVARAEFMARVKRMPTSAWPWSSVQAASPRSGGVVYSPDPGALAPAVLVLLRGQVDTADADPKNRIPDRERPEGAVWEPFYRALDMWDTATLQRWMAPQGWRLPSATQVTANLNVRPRGGVIAPRPGNSGEKPTGDGPPPNSGPDTGTPPTTGEPPTAPTDGPTTGNPSTEVTWRHPAVLAAGATALSTIGVVLYSLRRSRSVPAPSGPHTDASGGGNTR